MNSNDSFLCFDVRGITSRSVPAYVTFVRSVDTEGNGATPHTQNFCRSRAGRYFQYVSTTRSALNVTYRSFGPAAHRLVHSDNVSTGSRRSSFTCAVVMPLTTFSKYFSRFSSSAGTRQRFI